MRIDEFERHLDAHGPSLAGWPILARLRARRLLARSSDARALLEEAAVFDARLAQALAPTALSASLHARLHAIPDDFPTHAAAGREAGALLLRPVWYVGSAVAMASLAGGVILGAIIDRDAGASGALDLAALAYGQPSLALALSSERAR